MTNKKINGTHNSGRQQNGGQQSRGQQNRGATALAEMPRENTRPPATVQVNWPSAGADSVARRFGIDENSVAERREFVRLGEEDRALLGSMAGWAQEVAPDVAREFYD